MQKLVVCDLCKKTVSKHTWRKNGKTREQTGKRVLKFCTKECLVVFREKFVVCAACDKIVSKDVWIKNGKPLHRMAFVEGALLDDTAPFGKGDFPDVVPGAEIFKFCSGQCLGDFLLAGHLEFGMDEEQALEHLEKAHGFHFKEGENSETNA